MKTKCTFLWKDRALHNVLHRLHLFVPQWFNWLCPAHKWRSHDNGSGWRVRAAIFPFIVAPRCCFLLDLFVLPDSFMFPFHTLFIFHAHSAPCVFGVSTRRSLSARWSRLTVAMATRGWSSLIGWPQSQPFRTPTPSPQVLWAVRITSFLLTQTQNHQLFSQTFIIKLICCVKKKIFINVWV